MTWTQKAFLAGLAGLSAERAVSAGLSPGTAITRFTFSDLRTYKNAMNTSWPLMLGWQPNQGAGTSNANQPPSHRGWVLAAMLPLFFLAFCASMSAATVTVTSLANSGPGSLRQALITAGSGDTIVFAVQGKIALSNEMLTISKDVRITGPASGSVLIDGQGGTEIFGVNSNITAFISNLTLTNGNNRLTAQFNGAGGIENHGTLTLTNCVIVDCTGEFWGGGILNSGTLSLIGCVITHCQANDAGGISSAGTLSMTRCTIANCGAFYGSGGMRVSGTTTVRECTITGNLAEDGSGGGIYGSGTVVIDRSTLSDNLGFGFFDGSGGGITISSGTLFMTNSTLSENEAAGRASGAGGGIFGLNATIHLDSCTICSNTVYNGTETTNPTALAGGGLYLKNTSFDAKNTILAGNFSSVWPPGTLKVNSDCFGTLNSKGFNLVQDLTGTTLTGDLSTCVLRTAPQLDPLRNNGGASKTHALQPSSPAIDQGNSSVMVDQRNLPRAIDVFGATNRANGSDIGAFEVQAGSLTIEAEQGALTSPMQMGNDTKASQGKYIFSPAANTGRASYSVTIPVAANYVIWCRVLASNYNTDSFFVTLDNGAEQIYDVAENIQTNAWQWTRMIGRATNDPVVHPNARVFSLAAGPHKLTFRNRDAYTRLDRLLVTADTNFIPAIALEAELAVLTAPMAVSTDAGASQSNYVASPTADKGITTFVFSIPATNQYFVWCRVLATNGNADSFYVSADGGQALIYDVAEGSWTNQWQWTRLNGRTNGAPVNLAPRVFSFSQGIHSLVFQGREANTKLDRVLLTADPKFNPNEDLNLLVSNQSANGPGNSKFLSFQGYGEFGPRRPKKE